MLAERSRTASHRRWKGLLDVQRHILVLCIQIQSRNAPHFVGTKRRVHQEGMSPTAHLDQGKSQFKPVDLVTKTHPFSVL